MRSGEMKTLWEKGKRKGMGHSWGEVVGGSVAAAAAVVVVGRSCSTPAVAAAAAAVVAIVDVGRSFGHSTPVTACLLYTSPSPRD